MNPTLAWAGNALMVAIPLLTASTATAQSCAIPAPADHQFQPVWGGESWAVFSEELVSGLRIWVGEDGGRLRTSHDGGATWVFATTPLDFASSVLDIWFYPGGTHGFAAARGGRLLETFDGGLNWVDVGTSSIKDAYGAPATLWGVRGLDNGDLIISGDWILKISHDNGASWTPITVWDRHPSLANAVTITQRRLTLFRLDLIGDSSAFTASVGAKWEGIGGETGAPGPPDGKAHGILLHTNTNLPNSNGGHDWWISLDDGPLTNNLSTPTMVEPWAVRFAAGSTSLQSSLGFAVGGRGGNNPSRYYVTHNSGRTWTFDDNAAVTMYDVSARLNGEALIGGYSGTYHLRDSVTGLWTPKVMTSNNGLDPTQYEATGAFGGSSLYGDDGMLLVGDFGQQRISDDDGSTWKSMSPLYPKSDELEMRVFDCAFQATSPKIGYMVGQQGQVFRTRNYGCDWTLVHPNNGKRMIAVDVSDQGPAVAVGDNGNLAYSLTPNLVWQAGALVAGSSIPLSSISFTDVNFAGPGEIWALGKANNAPVIAYSNTAGATWQLMNTPNVPNLRLNAIAFTSPTEGLVVGSIGGNTPMAYRINFLGVQPTYVDLNASGLGFVGELFDVAIGSGPLSSAKAIAVGSSGHVAEWTGTTFVTSAGQGLLPFDLLSVDVSPTNGTVLIGGLYDNDPFTSAYKGKLIRYDATSSWHLVRGLFGKDVTGISLTADDDGFVAGQTGPTSSSFVNGNLASPVVLHYNPN